MKKRIRKHRAEHKWYPFAITADEVKDAVRDWAWMRGMFALHEIEGLVDGRLDAILIPLEIDCPMFTGMRSQMKPNEGWTRRLGLVGVEVKVDKQDFKHGLESGQFDRYGKDLNGLYIAGPIEVIDHKQVPKDYGVLYVSRNPKGELSVVCKRHPHWKWIEPMDHDKAWRLVWAMAKSMRRQLRIQGEHKDSEIQKVHSAAGRAIGRAVAELYDARITQ